MLSFNCAPFLLAETKKTSYDKHGKDEGCLTAAGKQIKPPGACKSHQEMRLAAGSWHAESGGVIFLPTLSLPYL